MLIIDMESFTIYRHPCLCGVVGKASDFKSDFSGSSQGHPFASSNLTVYKRNSYMLSMYVMHIQQY